MVLCIPMLNGIIIKSMSLRCVPCYMCDGTGSDELSEARARLCQEWSSSIQKRRPRFLPFISARQWARAMPFDTEEDWLVWIENGEKRNPYIPSRPNEIYAESGWAGWQDFLNGPIEPANVVFQEGYRRGKWLTGPLRDLPLRSDDGDDDS
eukprot:CAMPEP_0119341212 /NCGR_PEP_ID=MMETSP1333-20130426/101880_1 /TAXON_ID=418940 /ORGANISM="Scyphosphaera apsteinii, Strain RCC1455" /LENGTH=150 /DNA_ID=CAMNT_0007353131 /DNA_START=21 /DNA_END=473 /DNA_ORIENTATION=-